MGQTARRRQVSTLIDRDLWKQAMNKDIVFARALELGVEIMLGGSSEIEELQANEDIIKSQLAAVRSKIKMLQGKPPEEGIDKKIILEHIKLIERHSVNLAAGCGINFLTKNWNHTTSMKVVPLDYLKVLKRYQAGEFTNNGEVLKSDK